MPGVNDWKTVQMYHPTLPPRTAFKPEVYESLKAEGYTEGYRHQEYPKAMYPPNYHTSAKQVLVKGEWLGDWAGLKTITVKNAAEEAALKKKGWLDHMPRLAGDGVQVFEVIEDFNHPVAVEMKKHEPALAAAAARNAANEARS